MRIRNFIHKGLRRLYEEDNSKGVSANAADKLRKMLAFLDDIEGPEELHSLPGWRAHTLTGDRKGTWSLSVTRNLRLTFLVDKADSEIYDVNLEDYHQRRRSRLYADQKPTPPGRFYSNRNY